jgi:hypothetical protein
MTPSTHLEKDHGASGYGMSMPLHSRCYLSWLQGGLEGVLLSKMCTALKVPILIEWGLFRMSLESSFGATSLSVVLPMPVYSQCLSLGLGRSVRYSVEWVDVKTPEFMS